MTFRFHLFTFAIFLLLICCSDEPSISLKPHGTPVQDVVTIRNGDLNVTFIDNMKWGQHRAGYNGIAEMRHSKLDSNIFVPFYAGFNLEHIFGGDSLVDLFEPRKHPMRLYQKNETEVLLYQEATPVSNVESLTEFKLVTPNYIDITFQCIFHSLDFFKHDYAGLFWASYIHKPEDRSIYFKGVNSENSTISSINAYSPKHGLRSTHRGMEDRKDFFFANNFNATLASHFSEYHYSKSFYFGKFHTMVLAYLFRSKEIIRFSQSPTGGGEFNPAWDFQYLIPSPEAEKIYSFKTRLIYKPFISAEEIEEEYERWITP